MKHIAEVMKKIKRQVHPIGKVKPEIIMRTDPENRGLIIEAVWLSSNMHYKHEQIFSHVELHCIQVDHDHLTDLFIADCNSQVKVLSK
jgi:hypothetical protein